MITIGTDPEVFLKASNGDIIPAIGLIGGSKDEPLDIGIGSLQEDNVLAEFNIHPASSKEAFIDSVKAVMNVLSERAMVHKLSLSIQASHEFNIDVLEKYGDAAFRFGCDPDFNPYTRSMNPTIHPVEVGGLRSAGGHIHVGVPLKDEEEAFKLAATMDIFLGVPSVLLDRDMNRRRLYGKAGAFRFKPYGIEYRTLSNFWLKSDELMGWVYDNTILAANSYKDVMKLVKQSGYGPHIISDIINLGIEGPASKIIDKLNIPMPK